MSDSESSSADDNNEGSNKDVLEKKKATIKCTKGHKLKYTSPKVLNSNGYDNSYDCDLCLNSYYAEGSYHCSKCKHDLCENCYDNRADGKCPNQHQLESFTSNKKDIHCNGCNNNMDEGITYYACSICDFSLCPNCFSYKEDKVVSKKKDGGFSNFGALGELLQMIDTHMSFMDQQEANVDDVINSSSSADLLRKAKTAALETEKELMQGIMNISEINSFLNNIILVENLFNSIYTQDIKAKQESARDKYASNIAIYEQKPKPQSDIGSFVDLMFAGTNLHISSFKKWLKKVMDECEQKKLTIIEHSGARGKNIERAFYKSFYVYAVHHGDDGYKQMTDVLRCSLVFDNFDDLYQCFAIIEEFALKDGNQGILRCKDRFHPTHVPFGYRDMLINIFSPGSKVVAEIQLHHQLFFNHKTISHNIYKKARLFEENDENMAYNYADDHIRKVIGDKKYKYKKNKNKNKNENNQKNKNKKTKSRGDLKEDPGDDVDEDDDDDDDEDEDEDVDEKKSSKKAEEDEEDDDDDDEDEEDIFAEHVCEMTAEALFEKWKLTKYSESFINEEGYDDPKLWKDITIDELKNELGFKSGHAKKFISYVQELEQLRPKFTEIKKKRQKIKKQRAKEAKLAKKEQIEEEMVEVETPQKAKTELKKQTTPSSKKKSTAQPLAKPIPLKKNHSTSSAKSTSQPPPQSQATQASSPHAQPVYKQPQAPSQQSPPPQQPFIHSPAPQQATYATPPQQPTAAQPYVPPVPQQQTHVQQQQSFVLPPGWTALVTNDGKVYYANTITKQTQWNKPIAANSDMPPPQQQYQPPPPQYVYVPQQPQYQAPVQQPYGQPPPQYAQPVAHYQVPPQQQRMQPQNSSYNISPQQQATSTQPPQTSSGPQQPHMQPQNSSYNIPQQATSTQPSSASLQAQGSGYNTNPMHSPRQQYPPQTQQAQQYSLSQGNGPYNMAQQNSQYSLPQQPQSQNSAQSLPLQQHQRQQQYAQQPHRVAQQQNGQYPPQQTAPYAAPQMQQQPMQQVMPQQQRMQQQVIHQAHQPQQRNSGALGGVDPGSIHLAVNNDEEVGNDTDQFCEDLADEITQENDNKFDSAFNSLYGNKQIQQESM